MDSNPLKYPRLNVKSIRVVSALLILIGSAVVSLQVITQSNQSADKSVKCKTASEISGFSNVNQKDSITRKSLSMMLGISIWGSLTESHPQDSLHHLFNDGACIGQEILARHL